MEETRHFSAIETSLRGDGASTLVGADVFSYRVVILRMCHKIFSRLQLFVLFLKSSKNCILGQPTATGRSAGELNDYPGLLPRSSGSSTALRIDFSF
mmetsp:Transcript_19665/g.65442  ORF Transcript_19665/g.65442 Transcript_19665/m.65442 type:complete len:97 (-) Transcript_19665:1826-2116(-)